MSFSIALKEILTIPRSQDDRTHFLDVLLWSLRSFLILFLLTSSSEPAMSSHSSHSDHGPQLWHLKQQPLVTRNGHTLELWLVLPRKCIFHFN